MAGKRCQWLGALLLICLIFTGCSGESGPTLVFPFPVPTDLRITGAIKLADVAVHPELGGISPSLLDYRPFSLTIQDNPASKADADEEGRFVLEPISIRDQYVIFAQNSKYKGFVLEYMAADSAGLYGEHRIEISLRSTAQSLIARALRDRYGRRINPAVLGAVHIDGTVRAIAEVLEKFPEKLKQTSLDQVPEVKAAYTAMAESLNSGNSGAIPNQWVLLFYLGGDNNLFNYINDNIAAIESAGLPSGTRVLIQADIFQHGLKRLMLSDNKLVELGNAPDVDSSSGAVIADFVAWSRRTFPAANYCLVISSHADGWKNSSSALRRSLISDETSNTRGNPIEIAAWIKGANTQFDGFYRPLELLVFDACNMGMLEIAVEFKDCSLFSVFSQAFVPGNGFPYREILQSIQKTGASALNAENLGRVFGEAYRKRYLQGVVESPVTVSMVKNAELPAFLNRLENYFKSILADIDKLGPVLVSMRDKMTASGEDVQATHVIQSFEAADYRDLKDLLRECRNSMPQTTIEADLVLEGFGRPMVFNYYSARAFPDANGLSIGFPNRQQYYSSYASYESLPYAYYQFAQQTSWDEILAVINR